MDIKENKDNKQMDSGVLQATPVLALHEIDSLKEALGAHKQILGATSDGYQSAEQGSSPVLAPGLRVNRRRLSDQARQIENTLENGTPQPIAEKDKDRYFKRAKWLEDQFRPYLETRAEIHVMRRDSPHWQSAMEKARQRPKFEAYIQEWKWIMRRLDPYNPDADNLHKLRMEKTPNS